MTSDDQHHLLDQLSEARELQASVEHKMLKLMLEARAAGMSLRSIARAAGCSYQTVANLTARAQ